MNKILEVNNYSSTCRNCGKGCDPNEKTHETVLGYGVPEDAKGCGVEWEYITSDYNNMEERLKQMRPDLKFLPFPAFNYGKELPSKINFSN